jgi:hypothetical protein
VPGSTTGKAISDKQENSGKETPYTKRTNNAGDATMEVSAQHHVPLL